MDYTGGGSATEAWFTNEKCQRLKADNDNE